jgi:hypothetical protein
MALKTTGKFTRRMKKTYKAILAVALSLASTTALKASSGYDLIAGFTSGSGTDFMIDIGPVSSSAYQGAVGLSNGETWNLASDLSGVSLSPSTVNWGIVGDADYSDPHAATQTLWVTTSGTTPPTISGDSTFGQVDGGISALEQYGFGGPYAPDGYESNPGQTTTIAANSPNSWNEQTISGSLSSQFVEVYNNPNVSGAVSDTLWQVAEGGTPTIIGTFTLSSGGVLTFNFSSGTVAAPVIQNKLTTRVGTTTTVYFSTVANHIYTLYYTNSTGLLAPLSKWPTNTTTIVGNGNVESLTDTTTTGTRFYKVGAH